MLCYLLLQENLSSGEKTVYLSFSKKQRQRVYWFVDVKTNAVIRPAQPTTEHRPQSPKHQFDPDMSQYSIGDFICLIKI